MSRVMAIINQKGGVGKTTTSINLSAALALRGHKTLLVDLDPQAHSTIGLGAEPLADFGIQNVFLHKQPISELIVETPVMNLYLLPSHLRLDRAEQLLTPTMFKEASLHRALSALPHDSSFEYVIIDCRPSLGTLTINALYASQWIIVPIEASRYALEGFSDLTETIDVVKTSQENKEVNIRILLTKLDPRNRVTNDWVMGELEGYKDLILHSVIRRSEALNQANIVGKPIFAVKPNSSGAMDYNNLAEELCLQFQGYLDA